MGRKTRYAIVAWNIEDIKDKRPNWTNAQCEEWLQENESNICDVMIERGWDFIEDMLPEEDEEEE